MTTLMENKSLNNSVLALSENVVFEKLTIKELINLTHNTDNGFAIIRSREELINRGKDNIQLRISIKKTCKAAISDMEILLKRYDCESNTDKKTTKLYKNKFLNIVSLSDKLQLEWQKHDLLLKRP